MLFPNARITSLSATTPNWGVDGGTAYLVKFLKAFAAARAPFQMSGVFDNDTTGIQAQVREFDVQRTRKTP